LNPVDSPWSIVYDQGPGKYSINRVATLEEDIAWARDKQRTRMDEEQRLREEADHKQGTSVLQFPGDTSG
jgi:hypothetical protein